MGRRKETEKKVKFLGVFITSDCDAESYLPLVQSNLSRYVQRALKVRIKVSEDEISVKERGLINWKADRFPMKLLRTAHTSLAIPELTFLVVQTDDHRFKVLAFLCKNSEDAYRLVEFTRRSRRLLDTFYDRIVYRDGVASDPGRPYAATAFAATAASCSDARSSCSCRDDALLRHHRGGAHFDRCRGCDDAAAVAESEDCDYPSPRYDDDDRLSGGGDARAGGGGFAWQHPFGGFRDETLSYRSTSGQSTGNWTSTMGRSFARNSSGYSSSCDVAPMASHRYHSTSDISHDFGDSLLRRGDAGGAIKAGVTTLSRPATMARVGEGGASAAGVATLRLGRGGGARAVASERAKSPDYGVARVVVASSTMGKRAKDAAPGTRDADLAGGDIAWTLSRARLHCGELSRVSEEPADTRRRAERDDAPASSPPPLRNGEWSFAGGTSRGYGKASRSGATTEARAWTASTLSSSYRVGGGIRASSPENFDDAAEANGYRRSVSPPSLNSSTTSASMHSMRDGGTLNFRWPQHGQPIADPLRWQEKPAGSQIR